MNLSSKDQIIVSVAIALFLSLLLTFASYMASSQTRENAVTLASEGVKVVGSITSKVERFGGILNGPKYTWWLDVAYTTNEGEAHTKTIGVAETIFDRVAIGPVSVTYIKSNPRVFYIEGIFDGNNHTDADAEFTARMSLYGAIASAVFGLGLAALLMKRGGGGAAPASKGPVKAPTGPSPKPPGQFGSRQRRA